MDIIMDISCSIVIIVMNIFSSIMVAIAVYVAVVARDMLTNGL